MTSKEVKVYIKKQIKSCKERIECFEGAKKLEINTAHQDMSDMLIEMQMEQLDFYTTIEKDIDLLEILKPHLKLQNIGTTPKQEIVLVMDENMAGYKKLKEWLND